MIITDLFTEAKKAIIIKKKGDRNKNQGWGNVKSLQVSCFVIIYTFGV